MRVGILLLAACVDPEPRPAAADSSGGAPDCGEAEIWDGAACVPEACGTTPFPDGPADAVFVDAQARFGNGTEGLPFTTLAEGLAAAGKGTVLVAAGTYHENLGFGNESSGVEVRGRCRGLVLIDGTDLDPDTPLVYTVGDPSRRWTLAGVTVRDGAYGGVWALDGTLLLESVGSTAHNSVQAELIGRGGQVHRSLLFFS